MRKPHFLSSSPTDVRSACLCFLAGIRNVVRRHCAGSCVDVSSHFLGVKDQDAFAGPRGVAWMVLPTVAAPAAGSVSPQLTSSVSAPHSAPAVRQGVMVPHCGLGLHFPKN